MADSELTPKQQKFIEEYVVDLNATQAAIRAGYSEKTAYSMGSRLLKDVEIVNALTKYRASLAKDNDITPQRIVAELAKLGFSNMQDYMRPTADGDPMLDFSQLTRDQAAALTEVTVESYKDGETEKQVKRVKFRLADKRGALVDLGKHLGMFTEKIEHSGQVTMHHKPAHKAIIDRYIERHKAEKPE